MAALQIMRIKFFYIQIILIFLFVAEEIKWYISKFSNGLFVTYNQYKDRKKILDMKISGYYYWNGFTLVVVNNIIIRNVC